MPNMNDYHTFTSTSGSGGGGGCLGSLLFWLVIIAGVLCSIGRL